MDIEFKEIACNKSNLQLYIYVGKNMQNIKVKFL